MFIDIYKNISLSICIYQYTSKFIYIPTCLPTIWCDHPCKVGRLILTNKKSIVRNIQQVLPNVDAYGAMSTWGFHSLDSHYWNDLLNTLRQISFKNAREWSKHATRKIIHLHQNKHEDLHPRLLLPPPLLAKATYLRVHTIKPLPPPLTLLQTLPAYPHHRGEPNPFPPQAATGETMWTGLEVS